MDADQLHKLIADDRVRVERRGPNWLVLLHRRPPAPKLLTGDIWALILIQGQPEFMSPVSMRIPQGFAFPTSC